MTYAVARNPFARWEYERTTHVGGTCAWCGQKRQRTFTYSWAPDDGRRERGWRQFCNFECFKAFSE